MLTAPRGQVKRLATQLGGSLRYCAGLPTARCVLGAVPDPLSRLRRVREAGGSAYLVAER